MNARALIAEDEQPLADYLEAALRRAWPELEIVAVAANGVEALEQAQQLKPDVAFLDIRMPGLTGLEVARRLEFPCHVVFVTAYEQYALDAFEQAAADYLLKPVADDRLAITVARLKERLASRSAPPDMGELLRRLAERLPEARERLRWVRAGVGTGVKLIAVEEIIYFEAADKYTRVVTAEGESLIRTTIRELLDQLDPEIFWQIHRGTVVNARQIASAGRDLRGHVVLKLKGCADKLEVSRAYAHLFRQM